MMFEPKPCDIYSISLSCWYHLETSVQLVLCVVVVCQGPWAEAMMHSAMERGKWVFFQNCHLAPSWMPSMERLIENIDPDKVGSPRRTHIHTNTQLKLYSKARCRNLCHS